MSKKNLVSVLVLGALLLPALSFAQTGEVTGAREAGTGKATGRLNGLPPGVPVTGTRAMEMRNGTSTIGERKEMLREKMAERRSEILKRIAEMMIHRMEAAIDRMGKIATRIDSRIAKLKERGVNTTASEALLATAREKLTLAKTALVNAKAAMGTALVVADVDANGDGKPDKVDPGKTVREFLTTARDAVKDAHKALVETVKSLKSSAELRGKNTGTSTAETL